MKSVYQNLQMKLNNQIKFIGIIVMLLLARMVDAQILVSGQVLDAASNEPLIGASVIEVLSPPSVNPAGTITDENGNFSLLTTSSTPTITVSYTGYEDQTLAGSGNNPMKIMLAESSELLDQIVVVGYGVQKKSDLTGSVGSLKGKDLERVVTPNVEQALQGKLAGVYVTPASGQPGSGATIRIRGTGTLNNSNPLYVIDGMITQDASSVNPQDVDRIEVLKDASAAAIYGSRGANGVIIITTKNGSKNKEPKLSFSSYLGSQDVIKKIPLLDGQSFASAYNQLRNQEIYKNIDSIGVGTDWQDEIYRTSPIKNIQFGAGGSNDQVSYNFSTNYFDQQGILESSSFNRVSARLNIETKLKPWFTLGNNVSYALINEQLAPGVVGTAYRMPSVLPVYNSKGEFTDPTFFGLAVANPAADLAFKSNNHKKESRLLGNAYGEISLLKHLKFRSNFGYYVRSSTTRTIEPKFEVSASQLNKNDRLGINIDNPDKNWIWEQTLNFFKEWKRHTLGVLVGYTAEERKSDFFGASRQGFPGDADELFYLSSGNDTTQMNFGGASDEALTSLLFRTNYALDDKYLFTASMRVDKSSRFTPENRTGYFPSASVGWNVGREPFIESLKIFDRLKCRASFGILGNQALGDRYPTTAIIGTGQNSVFGSGENLNQGSTQLSISNPNLRWEISRQTDIGFEAGFLGNKLELEVDWYRRNTYDIIAAVPIPAYVGSQNSPFVNTAEVLNQGFDISLNYRKVGNISYNFGGNISPIRNEVLKLAQGKSEIFDAFINGEPATHTIVGQSIGAFFGFQTDGIFQNAEEIAAGPSIGNEKPGDLKFKDLDNNGIIDGKDRTYLGSVIPTFTYGFTLGGGYKNFDLNIDFLGTKGNKVFNEKESFRFGVYNWEQHVANAWTKDNPSTSEPRVTNGGHNYKVSDHFISDGSFLRLQTINFGYTLPKTWTNKVKIDGVRFFVSGSNLWTRQTYTGYTTEFPNSGSPFKVGFDGGVYPIAKSIQFGFDTNF